MTAVLPELGGLSARLVLDGELVASEGSEPYFPHICRRVLNRDMSVPLTFVIFDLLRRDGVDLTSRPYDERRKALESLKLNGGAWATWERFDDGPALLKAVCELGFEGVVAKNHSSLYRPNDRGWVKVKNPNYWRRDAEREGTEPKALASREESPASRFKADCITAPPGRQW
jgi:bifunctional non-homologous end joining protein LigD